MLLYYGTGARDFELLEPAWEADGTIQLMFNVRRLLKVREQVEALSLLEKVDFSIYPATNHFNDDFHLLYAEVGLPEYETFRHNQHEQKQAAQQIVEAITEAKGPYIRFVVLELALESPENWDVFLCHASEDKHEIVQPLRTHLESQGIRCWLDEAEIAWGEGLVSKIQEGISQARFVLVVLSSSFLAKTWAKKELEAALTLEIESQRSLVLPLIVGDPEILLSSFPFIKAKRYLTWNGDPEIIEQNLRNLISKQPLRCGFSSI